MKAYFFTNMYLSSIQHGIQAQHCTAEMFRKYTKRPCQATKVLTEWADHHKVTCVLNGGGSPEMERILTQVKAFSKLLQIPYAVFHESGIGNALTCIGIIAPNELIGGSRDYGFAGWVKKFPLAR